MSTASPHEVVVLIHCPDRPDIVAQVTKYLNDVGGNILDAAQHTDFDSHWALLSPR
jgi:formyltetrahydrofolate deformylase